MSVLIDVIKRDLEIAENKHAESLGRKTIIAAQKELLKLKQIAYTAGCMFEAKSAGNYGDAEDWERVLNHVVDEYGDQLYGDSDEKQEG